MKIKIYAPLSILIFSLSACIAPTVPPLSPPPPPRIAAETDNRTVKTSADLYFHYLKAQNLLVKKDYAGAINELQAALAFDPAAASLHFQLGHLYTLQGQFPEAIPHIEAAVAQQPDNPRARLFLAKLYSSVSRFDQAIEQYRHLLSGSPQSEEFHLALATLYIEKTDYKQATALLKQLQRINRRSHMACFSLGNIYFNQQKFPAAEKHYLKALRLAPGFEAALINLLSIYEAEEKTAQAIATCKKILDINPANSDITNKLAYLYIQQNRLDLALQIYQQLQADHPQMRESISIKIGLIYYDQQQWDPACKAFSDVLQANPDNDRARYYLANALEKSGQLEQAAQTFGMVPQSSDFFSRARMYQALVYHSQNDTIRAITIIKNTLAVAPQDLQLYRMLASLHEQSKEYGAAIDVLQQAVAIKDNDTDILFYLGVIYDKAALYEESIATMQAVLELVPDNADALNFIGYSLADKGADLNRAEKLIKRALKLKPGDGYITDSLGWVYFKKGKYKKALKALQQAVSKVPDDPVIREHLGDAYLATQDNDNAIRMYKQVLELDPAKTGIQKKIDLLTDNATKN